MSSRRRLEGRFAFPSHAVHHHRLRRRPVLEILEGRVVPATFTVNSLGDAGIGSNDAGDLRYCINQANANDQANTIVFDSTVFSTPQSIALSGGQLELEDTGGTQTITGPAAGLTIGAGGNTPFFEVGGGVTASISGLTFADGGSGSEYGAYKVWGLSNGGVLALDNCTISGSPNYAGGMSNFGTVDLTDCTISGGRVNGKGGGMYNSGTANLTGCTISGNSAVGGSGGGVFNSRTGNLTLTDCTVSGNSAVGPGGRLGGVGGGVFNAGTANLTGCTVSGNSVPNNFGDVTYQRNSGGGVYNRGTANLTDCTLSGNSAGWGGGVYNYSYARANLTACTVSGNSAGSGGGLYNNGGYDGGVVGLTDTIVAGNTSDIDGVGWGGSDNLIGTGGSGELAELGLAPLGNYGGPTQTIALLPGSPAIGAGVIADYPGTATPITTDQRGFPLDSPKPDIGAFQSQGSTLVALTFSGISNQSITYGASSVTVSGTLANGSQAPVGETIAVTLNGDQQSATIGSGGAFSTTFDTTALTVANSPYTITYAYTSDGTFASGGTASTLTVNPAPLTVTATNLSMTYGGAVPALTYAYVGLVHGDKSATFTGGLATTAIATSNVGQYAITQGTLAATGNYTIGTYKSGTLTITKANQKITWATPAAIGYGTPLGATQLDAKVSVVGPAPAGALTYSPASGTVLSAGPQTLTVTVAGTTDYNPAKYSVVITVKPAPLTVTADNESKTYGAAIPSLKYTYTGLVNGNKIAPFTGGLATTATVSSPVGNYPISEGTLKATGNYTIGAFKAGTLTVKPAPLTVTATNLSMTAGSAVPALTDAHTGLVNGDTSATFTGGLATPAVTVSDPGGTYTGAPIAATATVTGVGGTAARSLEGVTPTLTYYAGSGTSGTNLGSTAPSATGTYTVVARFPSSADYVAANSEPATFAIAPARATIALSSSSASPFYGQAVTFVATVNSGSGTPVGTVTFADGTTPLATVPLNGSGQAALKVTSLSLGSHAITATYNGAADFLGMSSSATTESVRQSATAIVLVPHAVLKGKKALSAVSLTAEIKPVAPGGGVPRGQVTFELVSKRGKKTHVKTLGTAAASGGAATLTFKPSAVLNQTLTIVYSGDPDFQGSMMNPPKLTKSGITSSRI